MLDQSSGYRNDDQQGDNIEEQSEYQNQKIVQEEQKKEKNNPLIYRKRRQIKIQQQELSTLFCDLVALINTKVLQIQSTKAVDKTKPISKSIAPIKGKTKQLRKKEQDQKNNPNNGKILEQPLIARKKSIHEEKGSLDKQSRQFCKMKVFEDYQLFMQYRIDHQEEGTNQNAIHQAYLSASISESGNSKNALFLEQEKSAGRGIKQFSVFREVSVTISPLQIRDN